MTEIPRGSVVVVDSSVLIAMGSPDNQKYQAFEEYVESRNLDIVVPERVAEEVDDAPEAYEFGRRRLVEAAGAGWLERNELDFSAPGVSRVVDRTRERMAKLSAEGVDEDDIEKTDTVLSGHVVGILESGETDFVTLLVSDRLAESANEDVLNAEGYSDGCQVVEGRRFLRGILERGSLK